MVMSIHIVFCIGIGSYILNAIVKYFFLWYGPHHVLFFVDVEKMHDACTM